MRGFRVAAGGLVGGVAIVLATALPAFACHLPGHGDLVGPGVTGKATAACTERDPHCEIIVTEQGLAPGTYSVFVSQNGSTEVFVCSFTVVDTGSGTSPGSCTGEVAASCYNEASAVYVRDEAGNIVASGFIRE